MNGFINAKTATKKLQFGPSKCFVMNIGKSQKYHHNFPLYVDGWKMVETDRIHMSEREEVFIGGVEMENKNNQKYLGQTVSADGSNMKHIMDRANKALGIGNQINQMLSNILYGRFHFEVAIILRNYLLIGSMLSSCEVLYNIKEVELDN